ncbi:hypothetical protein IKG41_01665 [Candidatus Saccharibacteria bacterium]|nr:hypothetical protein [Candidatus Saccharibacteria bacterium]
MDQNKGETPNPLNPTATPRPTPVAKPVASTQPTPVTRPIPVAESVPNQTINPIERPMKQAEQSAPVKPKKKIWPIVAIIICLFLAVGCGVTAVLLSLNANKSNAVTAAIAKLINGEAPANVAVNGDITIDINNQESPVKSVAINLKSEVIPSSLINSSVANITFTTQSGTDMAFELNEVYASNSDIYFKINNNTDNTVIDCDSETEEECTTENSDTTSAEQAAVFAIVDAIDDEWLKISTNEITETVNSTIPSNSINCLADLANNLKTNNNSIAKAYNDNQFIISTTENIPVTSKRYPVYLITFDKEKLGNFLNATNEASIVEDLSSCLDQEVSINSDNILDNLKKLPKVYTEIDNDNNFARIFTTSEIGEEASVIIDLSFDYPTNVNVSEPTEYRNFSDVIQEIFSGMFTYDETDVVEIEE